MVTLSLNIMDEDETDAGNSPETNAIPVEGMVNLFYFNFRCCFNTVVFLITCRLIMSD